MITPLAFANRVCRRVGVVNTVERGINSAPFLQQLRENRPTLSGQRVETLVAFILLAPFAGQQTLRFQTPQKWIKRALINIQPMRGEGFAQGITVVLNSQLNQYSQSQASSSQLQPQLFKQIGLHAFLVTFNGLTCVSYTM